MSYNSNGRLGSLGAFDGAAPPLFRNTASAVDSAINHTVPTTAWALHSSLGFNLPATTAIEVGNANDAR